MRAATSSSAPPVLFLLEDLLRLYPAAVATDVVVDLECAIVLLPLDRVALFLLEMPYGAALIALDPRPELPPEDEL